MKKVFVLFTFLTAALTQAQVTYPESSSQVYNKQNEVRLGAAKLLSGIGFEANYEFVKDTNQGFGASVFIVFNDYDYFDQKFVVTPYYRFYFTKSEEYGAKGFFVEGFADFYSGKQEENIFNYTTFESYTKDRNFFDIAAGLTIGKKWINTAGFVLEMKAGYGRNILNNSTYDGIFKGDISVGYRF